MEMSELYSGLHIGIFLLLTSQAIIGVYCRPDSQTSQINITKQTAAICNSTLDDLCLQLPDGAYPDYNQACRMFFICSQGKKAATFWCTKGFVFSLTAGHCEPPDRAMCPDPQNPSVLNDVVRLNADVNECSQGDGVYPNFADGCTSFYMCKDEVKTNFICPGSSVYDWRTKSCRTSNAISCNSLTCTDKDDGIYIDSNSYCKRYFECRSGNITEYICPEGSIYNVRYHKCTKSSTTRCHGLETVQCTGLPDGYYPDFSTDCKIFGLCMNGGLKTFNCPANTLFNSRSLTCEANTNCPKLDISKCTGKTNGIHPDFESGCRDFYLCLDGLLTHQGSCPLGKLLNPMNGNCQPSSLVVCSTIVDTDCDGLPDGVYPNFDSGCSAYYVCLNQRKVSTAYCPDTNLYDVATGRCLPSSFVLCRDHSAFVSAPRLFDSYNCDNRLGIFPEFSSDCRRYITCAYGQKKFHECPEGTSFDPETNICKESSGNCKAPFAIATFQCLPGDDGVYVGSNCTEWHECRNGIGFTNLCPRGMRYDVDLGKCSLKIDVCSQPYLVKQRVFHSMNIVPTEIRDTYFECPNKGIGIYSDSSSCRKFHFCIEGKKTSFACPSNFSYDAERQNCVPTGPSDLCEISNYKREDSNPITFSCADLENGMYSDYNSDCRRYFVCENGNGVPVYCPERQRFNSMKMTCDREEYVRCLPPNQYFTTPSPPNKQNRQTDDAYHVYRPDDLYTETYSQITRNEQPLLNTPDTNRVLDDYDIYSSENVSPSSTDQNYDIENSKAPNSIHNDPTDKKQYASKHNSYPLSTSNHKIPMPTISTLGDNTSEANQTVKLHYVKIQSRDFDAACRKGDTGFFPDYESGCKMFHICFRTIRKTYSCPSVLLFNPDTKNCDLPENVFCTRPEPILDIEFDCRDRMNQFIPDYTSGCRNYIGCVNNIPYKFTCPKGKIFNLDTSICEPESSNACDYPGDLNSTTFAARDDSSGISSSHRHVHGIPGRFFFTCADKSDGFYPDYIRHCHVFYRCVRGKKFSHYCKQGLLFNPNTGICDFEENVKCSPNNETIAVN